MPVVVQIKQDDPSEPPADWYDGKPKRCPGSGLPVFVSYFGECDSSGEKLYRALCKDCGVTFELGDLPEHTFIPVRIDDITFRAGKVLEGVEPDLLNGGLCEGCSGRKVKAYTEGLAGFTLCHYCSERSKRTVAP